MQANKIAAAFCAGCAQSLDMRLAIVYKDDTPAGRVCRMLIKGKQTRGLARARAVDDATEVSQWRNRIGRQWRRNHS